jgi:hypothetical protein
MIWKKPGLGVDPKLDFRFSEKFMLELRNPGPRCPELRVQLDPVDERADVFDLGVGASTRRASICRK